MAKNVHWLVSETLTDLTAMAKMEAKYPPKQKLKKLREQRGLSMDKLAAMIGREKPLIYRLEKGIARFNESTLAALAEALQVSPMELLEDGDMDREPSSPVNDAIPYQPELWPRLPKLESYEIAYKIQSWVLDQRGILRGDIAVFDMRRDRIDDLRDGDVVIAELRLNVGTRVILRQYLGPFLLLGNSRKMEVQPIHTMKDNVSIVGVMVSSHRLPE
jgi:transcriptional regulator with XRE-family HTH domain